jgi:hypothetical protein
MKKIIVFAFVLSIACAGNKSVGNKASPILYDDWYYTEAKAYFEKIGLNLTNEEIKKYKSTIFIATVPAECDIFEGTVFIGKSNVSQIFLKPGKNKLILKKGDLRKEQTIEVKEGDNSSELIPLE